MKKLANYVNLPVFHACENCSSGWVTLADDTAKRCECWWAYQEKVVAAIQRQAAVRTSGKAER
jgi:hypothetical protein